MNISTRSVATRVLVSEQFTTNITINPEDRLWVAIDPAYDGVAGFFIQRPGQKPEWIPLKEKTDE